MKNQITCPDCGSQDFGMRDRNNIRDYDVLECYGYGCGRLWLRWELDLKPKKVLNEYVCPICRVVFYHESWIIFHFEITHPDVKELIIEYE